MYQIPFVLQMLLPLQIVTYFDRWKIFHLAKNIFNEKIKENLQQLHHIFAKKKNKYISNITTNNYCRKRNEFLPNFIF